MINRRTFLAAAVSAAVLTGCAVGPDYDRPYVPVPKDYRHIQGEEADLGLLKARWNTTILIWTSSSPKPLPTIEHCSRPWQTSRGLRLSLPWLDPIFFRSLTTRAISESQKQA